MRFSLKRVKNTWTVYKRNENSSWISLLNLQLKIQRNGAFLKQIPTARSLNSKKVTFVCCASKILQFCLTFEETIFYLRPNLVVQILHIADFKLIYENYKAFAGFLFKRCVYLTKRNKYLKRLPLIDLSLPDQTWLKNNSIYVPTTTVSNELSVCTPFSSLPCA